MIFVVARRALATAMLKFFGKKAPPKSEAVAPAPAPPPPAWEADVLSLLSDLPGLGDVQNDVLGELRSAHSELMSVFRFYAQERTPERPPSPPPQPLLEAEQLRSLADVLRNESHVLADGTVSHKDVVEAAISLMLNVIRVKSVLDEAGDGFIVMDELEKRLSTPVEHRTLAALAEREAKAPAAAPAAATAFNMPALGFANWLQLGRAIDVASVSQLERAFVGQSGEAAACRLLTETPFLSALVRLAHILGAGAGVSPRAGAAPPAGGLRDTARLPEHLGSLLRDGVIPFAARDTSTGLVKVIAVAAATHRLHSPH